MSYVRQAFREVFRSELAKDVYWGIVGGLCVYSVISVVLWSIP